jgi:NAD-dependent SIR2 family protein deacetylase
MQYREDNILPIQNDQPELVFLFGAGASYSDGIPVQSDLVPLILNDIDLQLSKSNAGKQVRLFLKQNFSTNDRFPTLEEVFGFLDFHLNNELSLSKRWTLKELRELKSNFTKILHYIISSRTKKSELFGAFWEKIRSNRKEIGVITTNYDTLIDEAFDKIYSEYLIDYCIDLINFRYPNETTPFDWWVNPNKPVTQLGHEKPIRTKLIKIHGSLNWKYCNCCGQVGLTPWQHRINLKTDSFESFFQSEITNCPFDNNRLSSLIQVPTHLKTNTNFIFNKLYDEAGYTIRSSKTLVIVGYSFPEADVHIRALIKRNFNPVNQIIVINKSTAKDLIYRYESLSKKVDYHEMSFERFIKSKLFEKIIKNGR